MIHSFSAKNYYSFSDETKVFFTADEKTTNKGSYIKTAANARLSLVEAVIGPNASGKTTVMKALAFFKWLLSESYRNNRKKLPYKAFALNKDKKIPTQ